MATNFSATIARNIAKSAMANDAEMKEIYDSVKSNAESCNFEMFYYKNITAQQKKRLSSDGFKLEDLSDQRDGICYRISW